MIAFSRTVRTLALATIVAGSAFVYADPFPPLWDNGSGAAVHYQPVGWPSEPTNPRDCGDSCGDWKPYTRFQQTINDPRTKDASNGGTSPQSYVNVSSSCLDTNLPSAYYYLHEGATPAEDILMFRWRVAAPAHNYATGPSAGSYSSTNPWSSVASVALRARLKARKRRKNPQFCWLKKSMIGASVCS